MSIENPIIKVDWSREPEEVLGKCAGCGEEVTDNEESRKNSDGEHIHHNITCYALFFRYKT